MDVAVTGPPGSSALLVDALTAAATGSCGSAAHGVGRPPSDAVVWDPGGHDRRRRDGRPRRVVHLAGAGIGDKRWNDARSELLDSRVQGTGLARHAGRACAGRRACWCRRRPLSGVRRPGDELLDEIVGAGHRLLAMVCQQWEAAADPARAAGIGWPIRARAWCCRAPRGPEEGAAAVRSARRPLRHRPAVAELDHPRRRGAGAAAPPDRGCGRPGEPHHPDAGHQRRDDQDPRRRSHRPRCCRCRRSTGSCLGLELAAVLLYGGPAGAAPGTGGAAIPLPPTPSWRRGSGPCSATPRLLP
jgi:hypothetical protein